MACLSCAALRLVSRSAARMGAQGVGSSGRQHSSISTSQLFRSTLAKRAVTTQFVLTPSPIVTQAVASAGADSICIDLEHGPIDFKDVQAMIASTKGTKTLPMVRVPSIEAISVKRSLDLGAEGIMFPLARCAEDVAQAVSTLRYPPQGERGFGPFVAHSMHEFEFTGAVAHYSEHVPICCILIEVQCLR